MATNHHHRSISGRHAAAIISLIVLNLFAADRVQAQSPPNENNSSSSSTNNNSPNYFTSAKFNPSMAVIIVVLISAFFFLGFFSIYIRHCGGERMNSLTASAAAVGARSRRQRGLDPTILETFPTLVYSEVKEHKVGKGALECAICLNEFEDEDTIRLLPKCDHVFHQECVDAWLATHVTCPVCRTNYATVAATAEGTADAPALPVAIEVAPPPATDQLVIAVDDGERKQEMKELARIASKVRRNGSRRGRNFPRSHSTGHSIGQSEGGLDRYTLRLPENIRKDVIASGLLRRERSSKGVIGEESSRRGRSVRLGRSGRWPSIFVRSLSAKIPAWGNWRRGEEGSVKEGSLRGKFAAAGGDGGGFSMKNPDDDSESSTAALNRV